MEKSPQMSRFSSRNCGLWGPKVGQPVPEGLHPVERTYAGIVLEELQPKERICVVAVQEGLCCIERTPQLSRRKV